MPYLRLISVLFLIFIALNSHALCVAQTAKPSRVDVRLVTDEAEAVLSILEKRRTNQRITDGDWQRVFSSEGYVRLKQREHSLKRSFEDEEFKNFVLSDELFARFPALKETLVKWRKIDVNGAARMALAYLPKHARIRAKIYPVIKPRDNSFVFDLRNDPAIFLFLDPTVTSSQFRNTLAHELHHIGYGSGCPTKATAAAINKLPKNQQTLLTYIGAFGEGFAMLAAAGGPNIHPHANSKREDRLRWDRDVDNFNDDLKKVEKFFVDIVEDKLTDEEAQTTGFSFFGIQGPWYTVGWKMAVTIERNFGRTKLIECFCDQRKLLETFNRAAAKQNRKNRGRMVYWSADLVRAASGIK
jgi:hypothetical protein